MNGKEDKKRKSDAIDCDVNTQEKKSKTESSQYIVGDATQRDDIIHLNVGGWKFSTTLNTLRAEQGSMLEKMFSGDFPIKKEKDGTVFIDRNGEHFNLILDYLRGNMAAVDDLLFDDNTRKRLIKEASYYQLEGMKDILSFKANSVEIKDDAKDEITDIIEKVICNKEAIKDVLCKSEDNEKVKRSPKENLHWDDLALEFESVNEYGFCFETTQAMEFRYKSFDNIVFENITFHHDMTFINCSFFKAKFINCRFGDGERNIVCCFQDCDLVSAKFVGLEICSGTVKFDNSDIRYANFSGISDLVKKICAGKISFKNVKYYEYARFEKKPKQ